MNIDIENINTFENKNKLHTTQWRTIYEVIEPDFCEKYGIFLGDYIYKCTDNENEAINISIEVKNNIKRMAMEEYYMHKLSR